ncbi:hypothetical protein BaRGS_00003011, partial [Batillaria attramentaria]
RRTSRVPLEAAECFLVNAHLNKALEEQIWKKKSGLDLANYNMDESLSELSICLEDKCGSVPLRAQFPVTAMFRSSGARKVAGGRVE